MKKFILTLSVLLILKNSSAQFVVDFESGLSTFGYNDVKIPGKDGTYFSLTTDFKNKVSPFFRARVNYNLGKRHTLSLLYAPFTIKSNGQLEKDIYFQNALFKEGMVVNSVWKFNSYRLSYQYNVLVKDFLIVAVGITGKIRDAKIALSNEQVTAEKTNIGFVPLIRFYADWKMSEKFHLLLDGDALAAPQGRAEDVLLAIGYDAGKILKLKGGYRLLEGGADNDEVYNFSSVHYAVIGVVLNF